MQRFQSRWWLSLTLMGVAHPALALDQNLGQELEGVYSKYRQALTQQDSKGWLNLTARYRQMALRNQVVSQGLPWPRAVFDLALKPPPSTALKMIDVTVHGSVARLCYYGKIDFGIPGEAAPENALVIWFLREGEAWKFNTIQYANLNADPDLKLKIANGDASFLRQSEFDLPATAPAVPRPCEAPYHVAHLNVVANGCRATVSVNGLNEERFDSAAATRVVIGGLRKGPNKVRINLTPTPGIAPENVTLSVEITTANHQPGKPEPRVFEWKYLPGQTTVPAEATVWGASKVSVGP